MAWSITIGGVAINTSENRATRSILRGSVSLKRSLNGRDACGFTVDSEDGTYTPLAGAPVVVERDSVRLYAGYVWSVQTRIFAGSTLRRHEVTCVDNSWLCDKRPAAERSWNNATSGTIVSDIITHSMSGDGIDTSLVATGTTLDGEYKVTGYPTVTEALNAVAVRAESIWYIDPTKHLRFFSSSTLGYSATFDATLSNCTEISPYRSLEEYANKIILKLGQYVRPEDTQEFTGDGSTSQFALSYPVAAQPTVKVNGATQSVGIYGVDEGVAWLWSKGSNYITQDIAGTPPASGATISITYLGIEQATIQATADGTGGYSDQISERQAVEGGSGLHVKVVEYSELANREQADNRVHAILSAVDEIPQICVYRTCSELESSLDLLKPGDKQQILGVEYLIRSVKFQDDPRGDVLWLEAEGVRGPLLQDFAGLLKSLAGGDQLPPGTPINEPAAPPAPTAVTFSITGDAAVYGIESSVSLPSDVGTAVDVERRLFVYSDSGGTTLEGPPSFLSYTPLDLATAQDGGSWTKPSSDRWVNVGARTRNYRGATSSWTMGAAVQKLDMVAETETGDLSDVTMDSSYSASGYVGTGLLKRWNDDGSLTLRARYTPPIDGIGETISTRLIAAGVYLEDSAGAVQSFSDQPYTGIVTDPDNRKAVVEITVSKPASATTLYLQLTTVATNGRQAFRKVTGPAPPQSGRYLSVEITSGEIGENPTPDETPGAIATVNVDVSGDERTYQTLVDFLPSTNAVTYDVDLRWYDAAGATPISEWTEYHGVAGTPTTGLWKRVTLGDATNPRPIKDAAQVTARVRGVSSAGVVGPWTEAGAKALIAAVSEPPQSDGVTLWVDDAEAQGVPGFRLNVSVDPASDVGTTVGYAYEAAIFSDSGATIPITLWVELPYKAANQDDALTAQSDAWPRDSVDVYARVRVAGDNENGERGPWRYSNIVTVTKGEGLDLTKTNPVTIGPGIVIDPTTGAPRSPYTDPTDALANGSFELGTQCWFTTGPEANFYDEPSGTNGIVADSGSRFAVVKTAGAAVSIYNLGYEIPCNPGEDWEFKAVLGRTSADATGSGRVMVGILDQTKQFISAIQTTVNLADLPIFGFTGYSVQARVPSGGKFLICYPLVVDSIVSGEKYLLIDSAHLRKVTSVISSGSGVAGLSATAAAEQKDAPGVPSWTTTISWTSETPTAARTSVELVLRIGGVETPLGTRPINAASFKTPPQPYKEASQSGMIRAYVLSKDGQRGAYSEVSFTVPASPTGTLSPLQLKLAELEGLAFVNNKLTITEAGVMNRLKLAAELGIDISGAVYIKALNTDLVLASLVGVSEAIVISNGGGSSVVIDSFGASMTSFGSELSLSSGQLYMEGGGHWLSIGGGGAQFSGAVSGGDADFDTLDVGGLASFGFGLLTLNPVANTITFGGTLLGGGLGDAAFRDVGTTSFDVASGSHDHSGLYAEYSHTHDSLYADIAHNHDLSYSQLGHTHSQSDIAGLAEALSALSDRITALGG